MKRKGLIVVVSGFSGTGKGTLMKALIAKYDNYALSVSATTRNPRPGEENGREYFFISDTEFEKMIAEDGLIEHAGYCKHYYGTPKKYVEEQIEQGKDVILEIEIQGALQIKEKFPEALLLFVMPPILGQMWLVLSLVTGPAIERDGRNRHGRRRPTFAPVAPAFA